MEPEEYSDDEEEDTGLYSPIRLLPSDHEDLDMSGSESSVKHELSPSRALSSPEPEIPENGVVHRGEVRSRDVEMLKSPTPEP